MKRSSSGSSAAPSGSRKNTARVILLNSLIVALCIIVGYLAYALLVRHVFRPPVEVTKEGHATGIIQLDVLNGCGVSGAATGVTQFLRARGYDVVEIRNYKTFDVDHSLVIDRTGDMETARKVAYALGIDQKNVLQQINHDYYVDVSVIVGKDYRTLRVTL